MISYAPIPNLDLRKAVNFSGLTLRPGMSNHSHNFEFSHALLGSGLTLSSGGSVLTGFSVGSSSAAIYTADCFGERVRKLKQKMIMTMRDAQTDTVDIWISRA
jgi:hypothetical protein